jgi:hypothetical protein
MYQARWGVNISGNLLVRQGFAEVFYAGNVATDDAVHAKKSVLVDPNIGDVRLPTLTSFDARFEKAFKFNNVNAAFDVDVFNLVNAGTVLGRQYDVQASNFNAITEIMNPRIVRFGVRFSF